MEGESFAALLAAVQERGFLAGWSSESARLEVEKRWGVSLPEQAGHRREAELMLATLDTKRAWQADIKIYGAVGQAYQEALGGWSAISGGRFVPEAITFDSELRFVAQGYTYSFTPAAGHYLDMAVLKVVNSSLHGPRRFYVSDGLGMPSTVFFLSEPERAGLEDWSLVDSLSREEDGVLHGYLADFWEQGMEEPPWLIFQDATYCDDARGGWRREGMHTLSDGGRLTVYGCDGAVLWAGTVRTRRTGWFSKLYAGSHDWFPEGMDPKVWYGFFHQSPLLRADYRPPPSKT